MPPGRQLGALPSSSDLLTIASWWHQAAIDAAFCKAVRVTFRSMPGFHFLVLFLAALKPTFSFFSLRPVRRDGAFKTGVSERFAARLFERAPTMPTPIFRQGRALAAHALSVVPGFAALTR